MPNALYDIGAALLPDVPDGTLDEMMSQLEAYIGVSADESLLDGIDDDGEISEAPDTTYTVIYLDQFSGTEIATQQVTCADKEPPQKSSFVIPEGYLYKSHEVSGIFSVTVTCASQISPHLKEYAAEVTGQLPPQLTKPHYLDFPASKKDDKVRLQNRVQQSVDRLRDLLGLSALACQQTACADGARSFDLIASALDFSLPPEALGDFCVRLIYTYNDLLLSDLGQPQASAVLLNISEITTTQSQVDVATITVPFYITRVHIDVKVK